MMFTSAALVPMDMGAPSFGWISTPFSISVAATPSAIYILVLTTFWLSLLLIVSGFSDRTVSVPFSNLKSPSAELPPLTYSEPSTSSYELLYSAVPGSP